MIMEKKMETTIVFIGITFLDFLQVELSSKLLKGAKD